MAGTSSVNCLCCRIPYQCLHSLNAWAPFSEKALFFTDFCFVASPSQTLFPTFSVKLDTLSLALLLQEGRGEELLFQCRSLWAPKTKCNQTGQYSGFPSPPTTTHHMISFTRSTNVLLFRAMQGRLDMNTRRLTGVRLRLLFLGGSRMLVMSYFPFWFVPGSAKADILPLQWLSVLKPSLKLGCRKWGCNKWGLKGCLAALPGNRPKSAFFPLFLPFSALFRRVRRAPGKSRKRRKKAFFLRYPQISLNPHLLNPHLRHSQLKLSQIRAG